MMKRPLRTETFRSTRRIWFALALTLAGTPQHTARAEDRVRAISIEAERPVRQDGSEGSDLKRAAFGGQVLGREWGSHHGHFAAYAFRNEKDIAPARISLRYARALEGHGDLGVKLDGKSVGRLRYESTGGWGGTRKEFRWVSLDLEKLSAGDHILRFEVLSSLVDDRYPKLPIAPDPVLDRVGNRRDKNSVGHGGNIAVYTGSPSKFFYSTHELGNVFSAVDGGTLNWFPDQCIVSPSAGAGAESNVNLDRIVISKSPEPFRKDASAGQRATNQVLEQRQVSVTADDVVISRIHLSNLGDKPVTHRIRVTGDCTASRNWRGKRGGDKQSKKVGDFMTLFDRNVFPNLTGGLFIVVGGSKPPVELNTAAAGTYYMVYDVEIPPKAATSLTLACAIHPKLDVAQKRLVATLALSDPLAVQREAWSRYYRDSVPRFRCSDSSLEELYAFRWFLLRFSTVGGDLGYYRDPIVLEGRQAYQTYCCFSAPFLAFDLSWSRDPRPGYNQLITMAAAAARDGRWPWYTAPNTNRVPIHHRSGTGLSLLTLAAWKHYQVHGSKKQAAEIYPSLKRNMEWWLKDRDADEDGLFVIDHQLETGMDDLLRWPNPRLRYRSVDATSYAYANLIALSRLAAELDFADDAKRYRELAARTATAVKKSLWNEMSKSFHDRHPETGHASKLLAITTFYPHFAGLAGKDELDVFRRHLFDPEKFWLPHPVPALSYSEKRFSRRGFWQGPSWPAATCHVVEALATAAKRHDRGLLPKAAELFTKAAKNHLRSRADFYERYEPLTGEPLSTFRDYMHSWWIDLFVRHVAGFDEAPDGSRCIDPIPLGLKFFALEGVPYRGAIYDIVYETRPAESAEFDVGLTVTSQGKVIVRKPEYRIGGERVALP
ncbi:MAG: trehalase family glycosidase [Planctomycetota bacterium]